MAPIRVLFVCMGNICRSPMAERVFATMVERAGLSESILVDSAGTSGWHEDAPADERAVTAAAMRGYDLSPCRSRPVDWRDYGQFDYIMAMDEVNLQTLKQGTSEERGEKIHLFMTFACEENTPSVPDPFDGDEEKFHKVLDMIEAGSAALLDHIQYYDL
ncbi:MAG: low molecular weight phosphotyrosine protein phosphatase [Alphaproteobacteria bacterium]|nr:MAG: low molecular weight phosphotyrosine protein phosphatase [Alphaproteobacteria bacterium]